MGDSQEEAEHEGEASEAATRARNTPVRRARTRLRLHSRRIQLDRKKIQELWPQHTAEEVARTLGVDSDLVRRELWIMADLGLIPEPPYNRPKWLMTPADVEEARRIVDEAERLAREARTAGLTDDGRKEGGIETHNRAVLRYEDAVREVRRKGKEPGFTRILEANRGLAAKLEKMTGQHAPGLSRRTLGRLMKEYPPDDVPDAP